MRRLTKLLVHINGLKEINGDHQIEELVRVVENVVVALPH